MPAWTTPLFRPLWWTATADSLSTTTTWRLRQDLGQPSCDGKADDSGPDHSDPRQPHGPPQASHAAARSGSIFSMGLVPHGEEKAPNADERQGLEPAARGIRGADDPAVDSSHRRPQLRRRLRQQPPNLVLALRHAGIGEGRERAAFGEELGHLLALRGGRQGDHVLLRVPCRQPRKASRAGAAPDDQRRVRLLYRPRREAAAGEVEVGAVVAEGILRPEAGDHLQLLFQQVDSPSHRRKGEPVRVVLGLQPARAEPELGPAVADVVERGRQLREHGRVPERHGADECAQPDALGVARERSEVDPRVCRHALLGRRRGGSSARRGALRRSRTPPRPAPARACRRSRALPGSRSRRRASPLVVRCEAVDRLCQFARRA